MTQPTRTEILEACYRDGTTGKNAAKLAKISQSAAYKWFAKFAAHKIPRGKRPLKRPRRTPSPYGWGWPAPYTGPDWIGKAIDG